MIITGRLKWLAHLSRMQEPDTDPCRKLTLLKPEGAPLSFLLNRNRSCIQDEVPGVWSWPLTSTWCQGYIWVGLYLPLPYALMECQQTTVVFS